MHQTLLTLAIIGYVAATGLALAFLVQRDELLHRLAALATLAAWILHTGALIALAIELGRPPFGSLPEAISVSAWVVVLLDMSLERRYGLSGLGAFVLPVALALSLQSASIRPLIGQTLSGAWVWVHIGLALVGIAAFVFNFAGALMYLLQERQLRAKRPGALYYSLPALETLDRLTYRALALGFPFLTTGLLLGVLWAGAAWGSIFAFDPLALLSFIAWALYAATLAGGAPRASRSWDSPLSRSRWARGCFSRASTADRMPLFVAGVSHRNAPVELREQLAVDEDKLRGVLRDIAATGVVREALILSTCNRVEVYAVAEVPGEARTATFRHLCSHRGVDSTSVETVLYTHTESEAVRHAFRVAAGPDAMSVGGAA